MQYRIMWHGEPVTATKVEMRTGNDNWPSFELPDGSMVGIHKTAVIGPVSEDTNESQ